MKPAMHRISMGPQGMEVRRVVVWKSEHSAMGLVGDNRTGKKLQQVEFTKRDGVVSAKKLRGRKLELDAELEEMAKEFLS